MGSYQPAAICKRGHVQSRDIRHNPSGSRCSSCGAAVLVGCPSCKARIRGRYETPGVIDLSGIYDRPDFCDGCGAAFPWVGRQGRIYELENLLDDENLDPAAELAAREQLQVLASADLDEDDERRRWERVRRHAPGLWDKSGARSILDSVISAAVKSQLGL